MKQMDMLKKVSRASGGSLRSKRKGRGARTLATRKSMHLVLRSSQARGEWSFRRKQKDITSILKSFAGRFHIEIISIANVGNHLHIHLKLGSRDMWNRFIRGVCAAIRIAVTGHPRWSKAAQLAKSFWDQRPFTTIVTSFKQYLNLHDYIRVNQLEGVGVDRLTAYHLAWREKLTGISSG